MATILFDSYNRDAFGSFRSSYFFFFFLGTRRFSSIFITMKFVCKLWRIARVSLLCRVLYMKQFFFLYSTFSILYSYFTFFNRNNHSFPVLQYLSLSLGKLLTQISPRHTRSIQNFGWPCYTP